MEARGREKEGRESVSYPVQRASRYEGEKKKWSRANVQNRYIIEDEADDNRKVASSREKKENTAATRLTRGGRNKRRGCVMRFF